MQSAPSRKLPVLTALAAAAAVTFACGPSRGPRATRPTATQPGTPVAAGVSGVIGAAGGTLSARDGRVTVRVPPGALPVPATFSIQEITNTAPSGLGSAYRLGPEGTTFVRPVTFTFVAGWAGTPVDRLTIASRDAQGFWANAPGVTRDVAARTLTVTTTHFSDWTIVSADPQRDMAGTFRLDSTTDVPLSTVGTATLTYFSQDATDRIYVLSGTTTLQQPVTYSGAACTLNENATYAFPANIAEVLSSPDRFFWGTSAHWQLTCGGVPIFATVAFDTEGISFPQCDRRYVATPESPTPIISLDRLQGSYVIDCGARGSVSATWDFFRCGGGCASTNVCRTAAISCASGSPVCTETGNVDNGTSCGPNAVCGDGICNACVKGEPCVPANPCHVGAVSCTTGFRVCVDTGASIANGTSCGLNQVCNAGACNACTAGLACSPSNVCDVGVTSCATGTQTCSDTLTALGNGTSCGTDQVCNGGTCTACVAGVPCTPADPCHAGLTSCATGVSTCVDAGPTNATNGAVCGTDAVCNGGSCSACVAGVACTSPTNPCQVGTTSCATGTSVCANLVSAPNGAAVCGADQVCNGGTCSACVANVACTPANPCHVGVTSCATGVSTCTDTGASVADGSALCGAGQVCNAGACTDCASDVACTPANPCHEGKTSCSTGASVCVDQNLALANGTSCGSDLVCGDGNCAACVQGAPCTLVNACTETATIECSSGSPVCTARTPSPDTQSCGINLACSAGSCLPVPCAAGAACVPANPCHVGTAVCGPPDTCADGGTAVPDGTSCGSGVVCRTGSCLACPAADGTFCISTNPCAQSAAISCASGTAVCKDTLPMPDGTSCGTGLTCVSGACR